MNVLSLLLTATLGAGCYWLYDMGSLGEEFTFIVLTLLLLIFLATQVGCLRRLHPQSWVLNPVVLASLMTFVMGYGASNFLFFVPVPVLQLDLLGLVQVVTAPMVKHMALALVAALAMWAGYWSPVAASISVWPSVVRFQADFLRRSSQMPALALPAMAAVATGARLLQIQLGVFGYSATSYVHLIEAGAYTQYLALGSAVGKGALILSALQYYSDQRNLSARNWLYVLLALEVGWGVLSGFKSAMAMPFVIVLSCQYLASGRTDKRWFMYIVVSLVAAYAVIEPFRAVRNSDSSFTGTSISQIASTMAGARDVDLESSRDEVSKLLSYASRSNLTRIGSFGVEFADTNHLYEDDPLFLENILLAPLHAWIPRFIWASKPLGNIGLWYNQVVMGMSHFSSTAMGPVTYLYFGGGGIAVFLGFFFMGCVQRALFFLLLPWQSIPGACVFLGMLGTISTIDSAFDGILVSLCRDLPIYSIAMFFIFRESSALPPFDVAHVSGLKA